MNDNVTELKVENVHYPQEGHIISTNELLRIYILFCPSLAQIRLGKSPVKQFRVIKFLRIKNTGWGKFTPHPTEIGLIMTSFEFLDDLWSFPVIFHGLNNIIEPVRRLFRIWRNLRTVESRKYFGICRMCGIVGKFLILYDQPSKWSNWNNKICHNISNTCYQTLCCGIVSHS